MLREAIMLDPSYASAHFYRYRVIQIAPSDTNTHAKLGTVLGKMGNLAGAEMSSRKAIKLNPDDFVYHNSLGVVHVLEHVVVFVLR